jgi:hypothetical protein
MENRIIDEAELARWAKIRELKTLIKFSIDISFCSHEARMLYLKEKLPLLGSAHSWIQWAGHDRRHLLLAYAFLRGKRYIDIESKTREDNKPKKNLILAIVKAYSNTIIEESNIISWLDACSVE